MAGQVIDPSINLDVSEIQEKAISKDFTRHGEMFSAKNMSTLAKQIYNCDLQHIKKGSQETLRDLKTLLKLIGKDCIFMWICEKYVSHISPIFIHFT